MELTNHFFPHEYYNDNNGNRYIIIWDTYIKRLFGQSYTGILQQKTMLMYYKIIQMKKSEKQEEPKYIAD